MSPHTPREIHRHLLNLYPRDFREEYGEEIQMVFELTLEGQQGWSIARLILRELASAPYVLLSLHWREIRDRDLKFVFVNPDLPVRDGRHSWIQASMETLFFLVWSVLLVLLTYLSPAWLKPGWYRDPGLLAILAAVLPLPFLLLGMGRGMPRWVYPYFGMLLGYLCYAGLYLHLELILAGILLALFTLVMTAARVNAQRPLPHFAQHLGRSLRLDPLRWSFAVYGAAPLLLLSAYDDGFANNRTLHLFISASGMLLSALLYTRLKSPLKRLVALAGGLGLATLPALLDGAALTGTMRPGEAVPIMGLFVITTALVLIPALVPGAALRFKQLVKKGR